MFTIYKNKLITSDWHILHRKIWEYENRFDFIGQPEKKLSYQNEMLGLSQYEKDIKVLQNDFVFFKKIFIKLKETVRKNKIEEFYCLGDFVFNSTLTKINRIKENKDFFDLLLKIFSYLKNKKIKRFLILGNHDKVENMFFYKELFDEVLPYVYIEDENILLSHYPVNRKNIKSNYNNYLLLDILRIINKKEKIINFHGHTHSKNPIELINGDKGITYINTCLNNKICQ